MDIITYKKHSIIVFDGNITQPPTNGFVIYGNAGEHMLAYANNSKIITLNNSPYKNLKLAVDALKLLLEEQLLWTR